MAHYDILYIGDPNNIYSEELSLFDDDEGNTGELADYGSIYKGLHLSNGIKTSTALAKDINFDNSRYISGIYREDKKCTYYGNKGICKELDYYNTDEMMRLIEPDDMCTMLNIHL